MLIKHRKKGAVRARITLKVLSTQVRVRFEGNIEYWSPQIVEAMVEASAQNSVFLRCVLMAAKIIEDKAPELALAVNSALRTAKKGSTDDG